MSRPRKAFIEGWLVLIFSFIFVYQLSGVSFVYAEAEGDATGEITSSESTAYIIPADNSPLFLPGFAGEIATLPKQDFPKFIPFKSNTQASYTEEKWKPGATPSEDSNLSLIYGDREIGPVTNYIDENGIYNDPEMTNALLADKTGEGKIRIIDPEKDKEYGARVSWDAITSAQPADDEVLPAGTMR